MLMCARVILAGPLTAGTSPNIASETISLTGSLLSAMDTACVIFGAVTVTVVTVSLAAVL